MSMKYWQRIGKRKCTVTFVSTHVHRYNGFCEVGQQKLTGEMHIVEELWGLHRSKEILLNLGKILNDPWQSLFFIPNQKELL